MIARKRTQRSQIAGILSGCDCKSHPISVHPINVF